MNPYRSPQQRQSAIEELRELLPELRHYDSAASLFPTRMLLIVIAEAVLELADAKKQPFAVRETVYRWR